MFSTFSLRLLACIMEPAGKAGKALSNNLFCAIFLSHVFCQKKRTYFYIFDIFKFSQCELTGHSLEGNTTRANATRDSALFLSRLNQQSEVAGVKEKKKAKKKKRRKSQSCVGTRATFWLFNSVWGGFLEFTPRSATQTNPSTLVEFTRCKAPSVFHLESCHINSASPYSANWKALEVS